jgi:hypothetical protein
LMTPRELNRRMGAFIDFLLDKDVNIEQLEASIPAFDEYIDNVD